MQKPTRPVYLLIGALVVGTLDLIFAMAYWGIGYGAPPMRILHSIAAGLLGRDSYQGGIPTAVLGFVLHYFIASAIVIVYYVVSGQWRTLVEKPIPYGLLYGLAVYGVMQYVVIPLSAARSSGFNLPWVASSIVVHALFIGLPSALYARRARYAG